MLEYTDNPMEACIKSSFLGRMKFLAQDNPVNSLNGNPAEVDSWRGVDIGFIVADIKEPHIVSKLKKTIASAQENNVFVIPIVLADKSLDLKAATFYINPSKYANKDDIFTDIRFIIQSIYDIICITGLVDIDVYSIKSVLNDKGNLFLASGVGNGEDAYMQAGKNALENLSVLCSIKHAKGIVLNIIGNEDTLSIMEMMETTEFVHDWVDNKDCTILWAASIDNTLKDEIRVLIIMRV